MRHHIQRGRSSGLLVLVLAGAIGSIAFAGGIERNCAVAGEPLEVWLLPTSSEPPPFPWLLRVDAQSNSVVNGFPAVGCVPNTPFASEPGVQSVVRALQAWSNTAPIPIASLPTLTTTVNFSFGQIGDGLSVVTFQEATLGANAWGGLLGVARVFLDGNGLITESDIALNAQQWTWTEDRDGSPIALRSTPLGGNLGFADIHGVMTHEFGHFLGLGHSLVDASFSVFDSRMPTMFNVAQFQRRRMQFLPIQSCPPTGGQTPIPLSPDVLGMSARTLELDDMNAIAEGYQGNLSAFGAIVGRVQGADGSARRGAHVVAMRADVADPNPIAVLSYANGDFAFDRVPPGTYVVYVEAADIQLAPRPAQCTGAPQGPLQAYYFNAFIVPTYLFASWAVPPSNCVGPGCGPGNCLTGPCSCGICACQPFVNCPCSFLPSCITTTNYRTEFFSGAAEFLPAGNPSEPDEQQSFARFIQVGAGQIQTIIIVTDAIAPTEQNLIGWDKTANGGGTGIHRSPRGIITGGAPGNPPTMTFRVRAPGNSAVELRFGLDRVISLDPATNDGLHAHVIQVAQGTQTGVPSVPSANVPNGLSFLDTDVVIPDGMVSQNLFVQAKVTPPSAAPFFTNVMNVKRFQ